MKSVHDVLAGITTKLATVEEECVAIGKRVSNLESSSGNLQSGSMGLALQVVDLEDRNSRNNIRLRGIPDTVNSVDLEPMIRTIFNHYLKQSPDTSIELETPQQINLRLKQSIDIKKTKFY